MTILDLLKMGCKIEFEGGYYLKGDVKNKNIDVGSQFGQDGFWFLTEKGLQDAMADLESMAADDGVALDGSSLEKEA